MSIKMPVLVEVICTECSATDEAWWSVFGAEQPCLNCNIAPAFLKKIERGENEIK
jgi:hypothetical protein